MPTWWTAEVLAVDKSGVEWREEGGGKQAYGKCCIVVVECSGQNDDNN